ncbi:MAG: hypothetical protein KC657_39130 [Myxococcales bacterium]|nr:hypothetical protein [Myxococcales bacterium]
MATYIISYDLSEDADYAEVIAAIKAYGTWAHITQSTWAVKSSESAVEIRDNLAALMPDGSRLFVVKSGSGAAWRNVMCKNTWLKEHL